MAQTKQSAPSLVARALRLILSRRLHLPGKLGGNVASDDGRHFRAFRKLVVDPKKGEHRKAGASLVVRFRFARFSPKANMVLSLTPILLIAAQPGFRSKTWLLSEDGTFMGRYEWDDRQSAERYLDSLPMRIMKRRTAPHTLELSIRMDG